MSEDQPATVPNSNTEGQALPITDEQLGASEDHLSVDFDSDSEWYPLPVYDSSYYQENLERYKAWRKMLAAQNFEYAIGNVHKNSVVSVKELILQFPYHPDFEEVFFAYLVNRLEDCQPLHPDGVEDFLESTYGVSFERPDCDHLFAAIRKHGPYPVQAPENIQRAVQWLEAKKQELPAWPPLPNVEASNKQNWRNDEQAIKADDNQNLFEEGGNTTEIAVAETNPIDKLLLPGFSFSSLQKLLRQLELIDDMGKATTSATAAAVAGVVIALWDNGCLSRNAEGTQKALTKLFSMVISPGSLQGVHRNTPKKSSQPSTRRIFYDLAVAYLKQLRQSG